MIRFRVEPDREARLQMLAERVQKNRSDVMREAIDLLLAHYDLEGSSKPSRAPSERVSPTSSFWLSFQSSFNLSLR